MQVVKLNIHENLLKGYMLGILDTVGIGSGKKIILGSNNQHEIKLSTAKTAVARYRF